MSVTHPAPHTKTLRARGGQRLSRRQVSEIQRSRMLSAAVDAVNDAGYGRMTVAHVISRARVSRKTFYDVFSDREDCFLAAYEQTVARARLMAAEAYARQDGWREGVRAALGRLLMFMDEEPGLARLCIVEALAAGEKVLDRRAELIEEMAGVIDQGRHLSDGVHEPAFVTAEGIVGGVLAVLHTRLLDEADEPLTDLLGALMSMIVLPYLGARAASREFARPAVEVVRDRQTRTRTRTRMPDPLEGLNMRLTYRTVRALMVIADHPGASNREIAEGSGIIDQGQISKLLNRLAGLGLVENRGGGQANGVANAWQLTARGAQLERATRPR
jgi:AcrR family transcriptional regulator/DNA-binding MarR family transcriptional regulator